MSVIALLTGNNLCLYNSYVIALAFIRGDEFRPMFDKLGSLRGHTRVPFMALTATASDTTATAIIKYLHLDQPVMISRSLNRHNLYFSVSPVKSLEVSTEH